jgi:hypothetical protein
VRAALALTTSISELIIRSEQRRDLANWPRPRGLMKWAGGCPRGRGDRLRIDPEGGSGWGQVNCWPSQGCRYAAALKWGQVDYLGLDLASLEEALSEGRLGRTGARCPLRSRSTGASTKDDNSSTVPMQRDKKGQVNCVGCPRCELRSDLSRIVA